MQCSNCGKNIPFAGKVCPYCHADKSGDQTVQAVGMLFGVAGIAIGALCYGVCGAFAGGIIGAIVGVIVGFVVAAKR